MESFNKHSYYTRSSTAVAGIPSQQPDNEQFNILLSMMQNMHSAIQTVNSAFQTVNTTVESMRADMGSLTQRIIVLEKNVLQKTHLEDPRSRL